MSLKFLSALDLPIAGSSILKTDANGVIVAAVAGTDYLSSINSSMVTTALGYTPVPTTRTITINGTALDLSANRSWTISTITGNAGTATTLQTARTLTIGATGKSFNGSANVSWSLGEIQAEYQVPTNTLRNNLGDPTVREMALFHGQFNNKFRFLAPTLQEESTNGTTWVTSTRATAAQLGDMMIGEGQGTGFSAIPSAAVGTYGAYRLTWNVVGSTGYVFLNALYIYSSASGNNIGVTIERFHNTNGWETVTGPHTISNWPGHAYIPHTSIPYSNSATQYSQVRVTFTSTHNANTNAFTLYAMEWFGGYPQGRRNAEYYDRDRNVYFPAYVNGSRMVTSAVMASGTGGLAFKTSDGSDRMFLNNSGNVGIGTTSPSYNLDVSGSARVNSTSNLAMFVKTNSASGAAISYEDSTTGGNDVISAGAIGGDFYISTNYSERVRVTSGGNVGIGTTAPQKLLHINGGSGNVDNLVLESGYVSAGVGVAMQFNRGGGVLSRIRGIEEGNWNGGLLFEVRNGASSNPGYDGATNVAMKIATNGNVGIGTTSPSEKLHVVGNGLFAGGVYVNSSSAFLWNSTNGVIRFGTNNTERARIDATGNVGIGTTSPLQKLHISAGSSVIENTYAYWMNGSDYNWGIGRNIVTDTGFLTGNTVQVKIFNGTTQGFQVVNSSNTALFEVEGNTGRARVIGGFAVGSITPSTTAGRIDASNDIVAFSTSDKRLKENITPIANALDKVKSLTGVEFDWKEETKDVHGHEGHDVGVIAQEVQAVLPEAVRTNDSGYLSVRYEKMIALLVEAMKEQQAQIDELKAQLRGNS